MHERLLEIEEVCGEGAGGGGRRRVYVPYDKLVIAVGSTSSTHGVPGLEHCYQLKTIGDSQGIRQRIIGAFAWLCRLCVRLWLMRSFCFICEDNFEKASMPTTTPEERRRLLSFVVCGGGPTGVETAAEIYDLCQEDVINYVRAPQSARILETY